VTPPKTHKDIAIQALQAGFHVLMEKPITHTIEEAHKLMRVSRKFDKKIAVSQNYRWRAPIQTA
jgi:predicted dehydrogenase